MKTEINDSLEFMDQKRNVVTIVSKDIFDIKFAKCIQRKLKKKLPDLEIIAEENFRNVLFPFYEPSNAPENESIFCELIEQSHIKKRLDKLGVEIIVFVHGATVQNEFRGPFYAGPGIYGYVSAHRKSYITTSVYDIQARSLIGKTEVYYEGDVRMPMFIAPVLIPVFTENAACNETAKRISDCLKSD